MKIELYGSIIVFSIIIGYISIISNLGKCKVKIETIFISAIFSFFSIFIGAKLYSIITNISKYNLINAPLSSYGAAIGIILTIFIFVLIDKKNRYILLNTYVIHIPLFYGLSKVACHFGKCCYGIKYNGLFSVFNEEIGYNVFPIQLLESIVFIIIFIYCYINYKKHKKNNLEITIIISALAKFLLDYLRISHVGILFSTNQIISILFILITGFILYKKRRKN